MTNIWQRYQGRRLLVALLLTVLLYTSFVARPARAQDEPFELQPPPPQNPAASCTFSGLFMSTSCPNCCVDAYFDEDLGMMFNNRQSTGVYLHSGELSYNLPLLSIPGRGLDLNLGISYRSGINFGFSTGLGWGLNVDHFLQADPQTGNMLQYDAERIRLDVWQANADGTYTAPPGYFRELFKNDNGSFTMRLANGSVFEFGPPDAAGINRLDALVDANGNAVRFDIDQNGVLNTITDSLGRDVELTWAGGKLQQITDFDDRVYSFGYKNDLLISYTTPSTDRFPQGKTTQFDYNQNGRMSAVYAPNEVANDGPPRVTIEYADNGVSVEHLTIGGVNDSGVPAGGTISYAYGDNVNTFGTTVSDANGNTTSYQFTPAGQITRIIEYSDGFRPGETATYTTEYSYNGDGLLLEQVFPTGKRIFNVYDWQAFDRRAQGNLLSQTIEADMEMGGDQQELTTTYTYEPFTQGMLTMTDPRGNDPAFVPPNGGVNSPERYTTRYRYDYEEGCNVAAIAERYGYTGGGVEDLLENAGLCDQPAGDLNGDGRTDQIDANVIIERGPDVHLLPGSNLAAEYGGQEQIIRRISAYNDFGQLVSERDAEANVTSYSYYPERDPNGDGVIDFPAGSSQTGGYLKEQRTAPGTVNIREQWQYDPVGNVTRYVDGRGVAIDFEVNELNQVIKTTRAAGTGLFSPNPSEVDLMQEFRYEQLNYYDHNDNLVLTQIEDRGNTSGVDGNPRSADQPPTAKNRDPNGGKAFVDTVYEYDILDNPVRTLAEVNNDGPPDFLETRFRYDANGNLVLTIWPEGNAGSAVFDARDLLFQETTGAAAPPAAALMAPGDPANFDVRGGQAATITYHYDGNRNRVEIVDAADTDGSTANNSDIAGAGDRTRFAYDGFDRPVYQVDSLGNETVRQYDPAGNVVRELSFGPAGGPSPTGDGPDDLPGPVSLNGVIQAANLHNDNLLAATEYDHDELNRRYATHRLLWVDEAFQLHGQADGTALQRPPDVNDGAADLGKGDLTPADGQAIPGLPGVNIVGRVTTHQEYDAVSRLRFVVEDDEDVTEMTYDRADRMVERRDAEGNRSQFAYDDNSNLIELKETDVAQLPGFAPQVFITTFVYDSLNRHVRSVDNLGQQQMMFYDSRDNLVSRADAQGPLSGATIQRRVFSSATVPVNDYGNVTRFYYDGQSRQTSQETILTVSGAGDGAHGGADIFGVKTTSPAPDNSQGGGDGRITTTYQYDDNSLLELLTDDNGNQTRYVYDNLNRQIEESKGYCVSPQLADRCDPPTTITRGYDPDGNLITLEDENGSMQQFTYDGANRRLGVTVDRASGVIGATAQNFEYDGLSRLTMARDNNQSGAADDAVIRIAYDSLSRIVEETQQIGSGPLYATSTAWRAENLRYSLTYPNQRQIGYRYDGLDRLAAVNDGLSPPAILLPIIYAQMGGGSSTADRGAASQINAAELAGYSYVGPYRLLERRNGNGTELRYYNASTNTLDGYDALRRPLRLRHVSGTGQLLVGFTHTYDRANNKLSEGKLHDAGNSELYAYDSAYRLVDFRRGQINNGGISTPSANALQRQEWLLDGAGSWSQTTQTTGGVVDVENRDHTSFNELYHRENGVNEDFSHDANGNQTADNAHTYHWDALNRLVEVRRKAGGQLVAAYLYDAFGRRLQKTVADTPGQNGTTRFLYDGAQIIEERDAQGALLRQFVYGGQYIDEPLVLDSNLNGNGSAVDSADSRLTYHQNTLYSVYGLSNENGALVRGYLYDAYGEHTLYRAGANGVVTFGGDDQLIPGGVSNVGNPFTFTGRRFDGESGLHQYRARYYDGELGRFLQRDPLGAWKDFGNSGNAYSLAANSPINFVDPLGTITRHPRQLRFAYRAEQVDDWGAMNLGYVQAFVNHYGAITEFEYARVQYDVVCDSCAEGGGVRLENVKFAEGGDPDSQKFEPIDDLFDLSSWGIGSLTVIGFYDRGFKVEVTNTHRQKKAGRIVADYRIDVVKRENLGVIFGYSLQPDAKTKLGSRYVRVVGVCCGGNNKGGNCEILKTFPSANNHSPKTPLKYAFDP